MSVMVLDAGNSIIKAKIARREQGEVAFPHAIRQLTESEYEKILSRAQITGNSKDYFRVNGNPVPCKNPVRKDQGKRSQYLYHLSEVDCYSQTGLQAINQVDIYFSACSLRANGMEFMDTMEAMDSFLA